MLDNNFDPYQALQQLANNDTQLDQNLHKLIRAHNALAEKVEQQQEVIDVLIKGLDAANKANQELLSQSLDRFLDRMKTGQL